MTRPEAGRTAAPHWTETLTAEAVAFGLLGKALYEYPQRGWIQSLADQGVFDEAPLGAGHPDVEAGLALLQDWTAANRGGMTDDAFDALQSDYTRLFIGPGTVAAAPWESVYFNDERMVFQEQTLDVRNWYRRFGLESDRLYREPDDHIGLELAFLAHLARLAMEALERGDKAAFAELVDSQRDFLAQHTLKWQAAWCGLVIAESRTGFYRGIALLTRGMLPAAAALLEGPLPA